MIKISNISLERNGENTL